ncbi:MAG: hypothetical protein AB4206_09250 [Xenococcaceae cyanobacterium]
MRILTITCCTLVFVPMSGLNVLANSISEDSNKSVSWTTDTASLTTLVAQTNPELPTTEQTEVSSSWSESDSVDKDKVRNILQELEQVGNLNFRPNRSTPGITISNPYGFGGDGGKFFVGASFASDTRFVNSLDSDGGMGFGVALGNARKSVGLELTYTMVSFGNNRDFGTGGFSAKIHRVIDNSTSLAFGYNGFLNLGDDNDFEDTIYGVATKIFRTRKNLNSAFSRVAVSVGLGNGIYRTFEAFQDDEEQINVFGSLAFRVAQPVSLITEWTGSDLAFGLSVAPFKNIPLTITPALRDVAGGDDSIHFGLGVGLGFPF